MTASTKLAEQPPLLRTGSLHHSATGELLHVDDAALELLGLSQAELTGSVPLPDGWQVTRPDGSAIALAHAPWRRVSATGHPSDEQVITETIRVHSHDFQVRWLQTDSRGITLGSMSIVVTVITDISEMYWALSQADELQHVLNQHAIVSMTDPQGNITYANDRFCQISGYTLNELVGLNHRVLRSGIHTPEVYANLWGTISAGKVWTGEICNMRKNGSLYWVLATIAPRFDPTGRITGYIAIRTDITDQKMAEENAERMSRLDPLTGLRNRRHFDKQLEESITMAKQENQPISLIMLDLDGFKDYNDILGHAEGDNALTSVAHQLRDAMPERFDLLARWGGEEFVVIMPGADLTEAVAEANRLVNEIRELRIAHPAHWPRSPLTISAGAATTGPKHFISAAELCRQADVQLYRAKNAGRNRVRSTLDK